VRCCPKVAFGPRLLLVVDHNIVRSMVHVELIEGGWWCIYCVEGQWSQPLSKPAWMTNSFSVNFCEFLDFVVSLLV
jgi:hypothetical protein